MAESLRLSMGFMGDEARHGRIKARHGTMTLDEFLVAAESLPISKDQRKALVAVARKSPSGSLKNILNNYRLHVGKVT